MMRVEVAHEPAATMNEQHGRSFFPSDVSRAGFVDANAEFIDIEVFYVWFLGLVQSVGATGGEVFLPHLGDREVMKGNST